MKTNVFETVVMVSFKIRQNKRNVYGKRLLDSYLTLWFYIYISTPLDKRTAFLTGNTTRYLQHALRKNFLDTCHHTAQSLNVLRYSFCFMIRIVVW